MVKLRKMTLAFLDHGESYLCQLLLAFFVVILMAQIVFRELGIPLSWSEEAARFSFVWFVFLGAAYAARLTAHNRVAIHFLFLPKIFKTVCFIISDCIWVGFNVVMIRESWIVIKDLYMFPYATPALDWQLWAVHLIFPLAFTLLTIRIIQTDYIQYVLKEEIADPDKLSVEESKQVLLQQPDGGNGS